MVLFGINFALFYRVLVGSWRDALRSEELRWYLALFAGSTLFVSLMILPQYGTFLNALRYGSFQVATIMSTTGYATADFNLWPQAVKALIVVLMFIGSCAGSTAGGIKVVRVGILCKLGRREVRRTFQPRKVQVVRFEGKGVEENRLTQDIGVFLRLCAAGTGGDVPCVAGRVVRPGNQLYRRAHLHQQRGPRPGTCGPG